MISPNTDMTYYCTNTDCPNHNITFHVKIKKYLKGWGNHYEIPEFYCVSCLAPMTKVICKVGEIE